MPAPQIKNTPAPCGALPTEAQLAWHKLEFYGFIHFTTNTFTGKEWGFGDEKPGIFNPTACDPRQWARTAREAGMKGLILTCKHHDGFCLWPSKYTEHSVKNSPWKNGKGNVVRELCDACAAEGLLFGVYLSPWDRNHAQYGTEEYIQYYRNQLRELLTEYGSIFEVWFDGANGGDGYYGGTNEKRQIDNATYYRWPETHKLVWELQPHAIMFSDAGPGCRWVGNEAGRSPETCWATLNLEGRYPGFPCDNHSKVLGEGDEGGDAWLPAETDVSIRPGWFYHDHEDGAVKTVAKLLEIYCNSVGHGTSFLLNLPPDQRGLIHEIDVERLRLFRKVLDALYEKPQLAGVQVTASNTRLNQADFACANVGNSNYESYWATDDATGEAWIELAYPEMKKFNFIVMQEPVFLGQRVRSWSLEAETASGWQKVAQGTTIGYKRIARIPTVTAKRLRLTLHQSRACPALSTFIPYLTPEMVDTPSIMRNSVGEVAISAGSAKLRYTTDGSTPTVSSPLADKPFALKNGGVVKAAILPQDNPGLMTIGASDVSERRFGLSKGKWKILSVSSEEKKEHGCLAQNAIDDDASTMWHTAWNPAPANQPHEIAIDLNELVQVKALGYLPRQDSSRVGLVENYEFYLSRDGKEWGKPVIKGRFDNIAANPCEQYLPLPQPMEARYVKFVSLSAVNAMPYAAAAEINVFA